MLCQHGYCWRQQQVTVGKVHCRQLCTSVVFSLRSAGKHFKTQKSLDCATADAFVLHASGPAANLAGPGHRLRDCRPGSSELRFTRPATVGVATRQGANMYACSHANKAFVVAFVAFQLGYENHARELKNYLALEANRSISVPRQLTAAATRHHLAPASPCRDWQPTSCPNCPGAL